MGICALVTLTHRIVDNLFNYQWKTSLAWVATTTAALALLYGVARFTFGVKESGETQTARGRQKATVVRQSAAALHQRAAFDKIMGNHIVLKNSSGGFVQGLVVAGRIIMTVKHFIEASEGNITIQSHRAEDVDICEISLGECTAFYIENADLAFLRLPNSFQPMKSLAHFFLNDLPTKSVSGHILIPYSSYIYASETTITPKTTEIFFKNADGSPGIGITHYQYKHAHARGDCGSPLITAINGNPCIIAIHDSGSTSNSLEAYATMVTLNDVIKAFKALGHKIERSQDFDYDMVELQMGTKGCNKVMCVGESSKHIFSSGQTTLRPSPLHNVIQEAITKPAMLKATKDIDPMKKALKKYGLSSKQFPTDKVDIAVQDILETFRSMYSSLDIRRELTLKECINGIEGVIESTNLTTSAGYPYVLTPSLRGEKRRFFGGETGDLYLKDQAMHDYMRWERYISHGIVPTDPFIATLKDERRPIEKALIGKTRLFCAGSLSGFLHNKKHFGGFCEFFKRIRNRSMSTLGLDVGSLEWDEMIRYMLEVGTNGLDGDQEQWDGRLKSGIAMALLKIFDDFYGEENKLEREVLFTHAIFPFLRVTWKGRSLYYQINGCMPSGWYLTFVVNSLVNAVLMRLCWLETVPAPLNDLVYYRRYVREKYAGDDNFLTVADPFLPYFNACSIRDYLLKYDQVYTPASKMGEIVPYKNFTECIFLKNTTGKLYEKYVPLFNIEANLETLNWIRKNNTISADDLCEANCNDVLRRFFFYGKDAFMRIRSKILLAKPHYNLVNFYSLSETFLEIGKITDPSGIFKYTKTVLPNIKVLLNDMERVIAQRLLTRTGMCSMIYLKKAE